MPNRQLLEIAKQTWAINTIEATWRTQGRKACEVLEGTIGSLRARLPSIAPATKRTEIFGDQPTIYTYTPSKIRPRRRC